MEQREQLQLLSTNELCHRARTWTRSSRRSSLSWKSAWSNFSTRPKQAVSLVRRIVLGRVSKRQPQLATSVFKIRT
jgi:hypothetical protein